MCNWGLDLDISRNIGSALQLFPEVSQSCSVWVKGFYPPPLCGPEILIHMCSCQDVFVFKEGLWEPYHDCHGVFHTLTFDLSQ